MSSENISRRIREYLTEQEKVLQLADEDPAYALGYLHASMDPAQIDWDEVLHIFEKGNEDEIQGLFECTFARFFG